MTDGKKDWLEGFSEEMDKLTARRIKAMHEEAASRHETIKEHVARMIKASANFWRNRRR